MSSAWVIIAQCAGTCPTCWLPGIGTLCATGKESKPFTFETWDEAISASETLCEAYGCVTEVARVDLVLGVCE